MKKYKLLSPAQRYTIQCLLRSGQTQKQIANTIGKSESTISRELNRNITKRGKHAGNYCSERAQKKTQDRHKSKPKYKRLEEWHLRYMRDKLRNDKWSPEYICERGKLLYGDFVSHETIYNYIWMCKSSNKRKYKKVQER